MRKGSPEIRYDIIVGKNTWKNLHYRNFSLAAGSLI